MRYANAVIQGITARRHNLANPAVIDTYRFPSPITFGPYDPARALAVVEFVATQADLFEHAATAYADQRSRDLMAALYAFMALGPHHVTLPTATPEYWSAYTQAKSMSQGPSGLVFGTNPLDVFKVEHCGQPIELACRIGHIAFTVLHRQYMYSRDGITIGPAPGDTVIDAGACLGDTALAFAACVGPIGQVFSFDPMPAHAVIFNENLARNPTLANRIHLIQKALADTTGDLIGFSDLGPASRPAASGMQNTITAETLRIDDFVTAQALDRVDFIKMDIEGGELRALAGATETIQRFQPKLAISGYHKIEDLVLLPQVIRTIEPAYRLYLEHYTVHQEETVIFATV